jgi:hypothetical protein
LLLVVFHVLRRPKIKGKNEAAKTEADNKRSLPKPGPSLLALAMTDESQQDEDS